MFYMIPNSKDLDKFTEKLILPLEGYSVGFDVYFTESEIESISNIREVIVVINKFLHEYDIANIKSVISSMPSVKKFMVEDLGLLNIISRDKIILFQNHIISNYDSVNFYNELGVKSVVISNELTVDEIKDVRDKTRSELFYFLINKNNLMYSKRKLISSYSEYKGKDFSKDNIIKEKVSGKDLLIKEEVSGTLIFDSNIFSANHVINEIDGINFIINFSNMDESEAALILEHYKDNNLNEYINVDSYFLHNKVGYKVGDIK